MAHSETRSHPIFDSNEVWIWRRNFSEEFISVWTAMKTKHRLVDFKVDFEFFSLLSLLGNLSKLAKVRLIYTNGFINCFTQSIFVWFYHFWWHFLFYDIFSIIHAHTHTNSFTLPSPMKLFLNFTLKASEISLQAPQPDSTTKWVELCDRSAAQVSPSSIPAALPAPKFRSKHHKSYQYLSFLFEWDEFLKKANQSFKP